MPAGFERPPYVGAPERRGSPEPQVMRGSDLDRMRRAGRIAAEVLLEAGAAVAPGVTTDDLDAVAHKAYLARGAVPSTLGYGTYSKSVCTSVNDVVCHGIPDDRPLQIGDIVNIDVTAYVDGVHGDTSATFAVGGAQALDAPTKTLIDATCRATYAGIEALAPGRSVRVIGRAVEAVAAAHGFGVVREYGGHGIGYQFHGAPHVSHVDDRHSTYEVVTGTCLTVEPILTAGSPVIDEWDDGWTVVTADGLPSAQFEHTVCVTDDGVEILTITAEGHSAVRWPNGVI